MNQELIDMAKESRMEYHTALVSYNATRIKRLEALTAKTEVVE